MKPYLDWSFKYLFATEESKPNLIGFLNLILMPQVPIVDVEYLNNESLPVSQTLKGCVFDIICKDAKEDRYLIEVQNRNAGNIKERIIYYTCRLIDRMGKQGNEWDYAQIKKAYSICLMNFTFEQDPVLRRDIQLYDTKTLKPFSDKFNIIMLQLPCIETEDLSQCNEYYKFLLHLLQQMQKGMRTIDELKKEVADSPLPDAVKDACYRVLDTADVGSLSEPERMRYESELKGYMDTMSCLRYAREEGCAEGRAEGRADEKMAIAKSMKVKGIDLQTVSECTGLTVAEVMQL